MHNEYINIHIYMRINLAAHIPISHILVVSPVVRTRHQAEIATHALHCWTLPVADQQLLEKSGQQHGNSSCGKPNPEHQVGTVYKWFRTHEQNSFGQEWGYRHGYEYTQWYFDDIYPFGRLLLSSPWPMAAKKRTRRNVTKQLGRLWSFSFDWKHIRPEIVLAFEPAYAKYGSWGHTIYGYTHMVLSSKHLYTTKERVTSNIFWYYDPMVTVQHVTCTST